MREMKDSGNMWIGAVPETWKMIPLKYLVSYNDEVLSENTDDEFEFDYIEIGSVQYGRGIICTEHIKFKNAPSRARRIVRKDDIIVSTVRTYLKAVATIPACNNSLIASTGFIVIRPHKILPRFMNYALLSESFISLVESHSTGISYPAINSVDVVKFKIPIPCRSEQERIAAFLDAQCAEIDAVLEKTRASIEEYKKLKQTVITQAVTKGIRGDRPMKNSGIEWIGEIPAEWKVIRVKHLLKERNERSKEGKEEPLSMSQKVGLVPTKFLESIPNMASSFVGAKLAYIDDLVFNKLKAHLGVFSVSRYNGLVSPDYAVYCSTGKSNLKYLEYIFKTPQCIGEFRKKSTGIAAGLMRLYTEGLFSIYLPYPALSEQEEIAEYLNEKCAGIDTLIAKKQQYLTEIENYKKSLIYEYVTGKKEVV